MKINNPSHSAWCIAHCTLFIILTLVSSCARRSEQVVMSMQEIRCFNHEMVEQGDIHLIDLEKASFSADEVRAMMERYTIDEDAIYLNEDTITDEDKVALLASRNLETVPDSLIVRYGLCRRPTPMRSFPTLAVSTDDRVTSGPLCFDDFQQNQVLLGEGVIVLHATADSSWYFVHSRDYAAWVQAADIRLCSKEEMMTYLQAQPFIVTTRIQTLCIDGDSARVNMGTRLPLRHGSVMLPSGDKIAAKSVVGHKGYLPLTVENVLDLAFSQEGNPYDWGNRWGYNDCSGFVESVYRCFGFRLPRNCSDLRKIGRACDFDKSTVDWATMPVGTILLTKGHALLYLGVDETGEPHVLHSHTSSYNRETHRSEPRGLVEVTGVKDFYYSDTTDLTDVLVRYLIMQ